MMDKYGCIALACQGGGSLGAYHIGAYQALNEAGYTPNVISGVSIGAFTAAILAGNAPENRVERLYAFWDAISWPDPFPLPWANDYLKSWSAALATTGAFMFGQPNFFSPRLPFISGSPLPTSYYDTSILRETLLEFIDFKRINSGETRLLLGAVKVKTGSFTVFDSSREKIRPEHIMASGAMPPGFPGIRINGDLYWDGGCVSNTPIEAIYNAELEVPTLLFSVDLFDPVGKEPLNMLEVQTRAKDILYASRTDQIIKQIHRQKNLADVLYLALEVLKKDLGNAPLVTQLEEYADDAVFDIVQITYVSQAYEGPTKDCEFSRASIAVHAEAGHHDMKEALRKAHWLRASQTGKTCNVMKFKSGKLVSSVHAESQKAESIDFSNELTDKEKNNAFAK